MNIEITIHKNGRVKVTLPGNTKSYAATMSRTRRGATLKMGYYSAEWIAFARLVNLHRIPADITALSLAQAAKELKENEWPTLPLPRRDLTSDNFYKVLLDLNKAKVTTITRQGRVITQWPAKISPDIHCILTVE